MKHNDLEYFEQPLKLPFLNRMNLENKEEEYKNLCRLISKGDLLCTFNTKSLMSKLISIVDNGPWSHVAMCSGDGTVIEAIPSGAVERPISVYADKKFHIGLYRMPGQDAEESVAKMRSMIGSGYNYKGALIAGLQKLLNKPRYAPTPADVIINSKAQLLAYV